VRIHLFTLALALSCAIPAALRAQAADGRAGAAATGDARLRPGDGARLRIWREPDMSGEFTVDEPAGSCLPRAYDKYGHYYGDYYAYYYADDLKRRKREARRGAAPGSSSKSIT
jgi:hypothetical protein